MAEEQFQLFGMVGKIQKGPRVQQVFATADLRTFRTPTFRKCGDESGASDHLVPRVTTSLTLLAIAATVAWHSVDSVHTDQVRHETVTGPWLGQIHCHAGDSETEQKLTKYVCEMIKHDQNMADESADDIQRLI
jgi:hypothetical protein